VSSSRTHRYALPAVAVGLAVPVVLALRAVGLAPQGYDARKDYDYSFDGAVRVPVRVGLDSLAADGGLDDVDTLLLPLTLNASAIGRYLVPEIVVLDDGEPVLSQAFEPKTRGRRYLDLSPALPLLRRKGSVNLAGTHVSWSPGTVEALAFRNTLKAEGPVLVVAPHPDDAEIAAFGVYSSAASHVVTLTCGDGGHWKRYGHLARDPRRHAALKGRLRFWDSLAIPALGGVTAERTLNLCYPDTHLAEMHANPDREVPSESSEDMNVLRSKNESPLARTVGPGCPTWNHLVSDLAVILSHVRPRRIVAPHPFLDSDRDHAMAGLALFEAIARSGQDGFSLWLYTNHAVGAEHFPFGAPSSLMGVPPWFDGTTPFQGVASFALDEDARLMKLFALEAMHDLRHAPAGPEPGLRGDLLAAAAILKNGIVRRRGFSLDYFRRAARPNEIFFTYRPEDVTRLREAFLTASRASTGS